MNPTLPGIAQLLVDNHLLQPQQAMDYQKQASGQSLIPIIVAQHPLKARSIAWLLAESFGLPLCDLDLVQPGIFPLQLIPNNLLRQHRMLPIFQRGQQLFLATDDPSRQGALQEIQFHTGLSIQPIVVESDRLHAAIATLLHDKSSAPGTHYADDDIPIIELVNRIILEAIEQNASDIHLEPFENTYRIRYRVDGILYAIEAPPLCLANRINSRIKVMANLDIAKRHIPQDGHFKIKHEQISMDCRVSTCPTISGEKLVLRLLNPYQNHLAIDDLGFNAAQKQLFMQAIHQPQGMIIVTGPTGSGKTVTLYSALQTLNRVEVNISTAEDPVEIKLPGVNQVNINPKRGLHFSTIVRAFLRQDPDIIMIGEIRDLETAEIAIKAAQTGHLVLSTLHTNSALESLNRLINLGIPGFNIVSAVRLFIAQRLVRKLCPCKTLHEEISPSTLIKLNFSPNLKLYRAQGCAKCLNGYQGRIALFECLPISKTIAQLIIEGAALTDISKHAQAEGMQSIFEIGLEKVKAGLTSLEELYRVTGGDE